MGKIFFSLLSYELLLFFRDRKTIFHSLGFFIIITVLFPIALSPHPDLLRKFAPGILWVSALLACLLTLETWLRSDLDDQALEQLLLSAFPLSWLIAAKLLAFWLVVGVPLILITPFLGLLLHLSWPEIFILLLSLLAGTPAIIAVGATCKSLTLSLAQQGSLLGLLVLPLTLPILIMGINALIQSSLALSAWGNLAFLSGISLLCFCFLPIAIAYILRWGMEG
jgi:heme exporter protein B